MDLSKSYSEYNEEEQEKFIEAFISEDIDGQNESITSQTSKDLIAITKFINDKKMTFELKDIGCIANAAKYNVLSTLKNKISNKKILEYDDEEKNVFFSLLGFLRYDEVEQFLKVQSESDLDGILDLLSKNNKDNKNTTIEKMVFFIEEKKKKSLYEKELADKISNTDIPNFDKEFEEKYRKDIDTEEKIKELAGLLENIDEILKVVSSFHMRNEIITEIYDELLSASDFEALKGKASDLMYIQGIAANLMMQHFSAEHNIQFLAKLESAKSLDDINNICHELGYEAEELEQNDMQDKINKVNDASQRRQNETAILFDDEDMRKLIGAENTVCDNDSLQKYDAKIRLIEIKHLFSVDVADAFMESFDELNISTEKRIDILRRVYKIYQRLVSFDEESEDEFPDSLAEDLAMALANSVKSDKFDTFAEFAQNKDYLNNLLTLDTFIKNKSKISLNTIMSVFGKSKDNDEENDRKEAINLKKRLLFVGNSALPRKEFESKAQEILHIYDYVGRHIN